MHLTFCVLGLQVSYLLWGVLQEQMMTQAYGYTDDGKPIYFSNSQFLVLMNRMLALVVAYIAIQITKPKATRAPYYKFGYPSISNTVSSWCQYEALKYVGFPTQVLAKSSKVIPVMLMGKFVQKKTYPMYEYVSAVLMAIGIAMFMFSSEEGEHKHKSNVETSVAGVVLLVGYMVFDRFVLCRCLLQVLIYKHLREYINGASLFILTCIDSNHDILRFTLN